MRVSLGDPLAFGCKRVTLFVCNFPLHCCSGMFQIGYLPRYLSVLPLFRIEFIKRFSSHFSYRPIYDWFYLPGRSVWYTHRFPSPTEFRMRTLRADEVRENILLSRYYRMFHMMWSCMGDKRVEIRTSHKLMISFAFC